MSAYIFSSHHIHRNPTMQPIVRWHVTEVSIRKISARRERWRIKTRRAKCRRGDLAGDFSANFDCTSANRSALGIGHWAERSYCETGTWATVTRAAGRSSPRTIWSCRQLYLRESVDPARVTLSAHRRGAARARHAPRVPRQVHRGAPRRRQPPHHPLLDHAPAKVVFYVTRPLWGVSHAVTIGIGHITIEYRTHPCG